MDIKRGDVVTVRTAFGDLLERVALTGVEMGRDFPVVWVCSRDVWDAGNDEDTELEGLPWPAEDVRLADHPVEAHA